MNHILAYKEGSSFFTSMVQNILDEEMPGAFQSRWTDSQMVSSNIADILKRSTVDIKAKRHGPHTMRHSLASNLLKKGTSLPIISEILGHSSTRSTRYYLRIDYDSLLTCAIPVPEVPQSFYEQEGGVFYD